MTSQDVAEIQKVEMPTEMQERAIRSARDALDRYENDSEIAGYVREEFDRKYNPAWHCIVGRSFGGSVAYDQQNFIYFYLRKRAIMLYKWG